MSKRTNYFWKITKNALLPNTYCAFVDASKQNGILHFTHEIEINFSLEDDDFKFEDAYEISCSEISYTSESEFNEMHSGMLDDLKEFITINGLN